MLSRIVISIVTLALLVGCSAFSGDSDPTKGWSAAKLYSEAKDALDSGDYEKAIDLFETLEARYPFGRYAKQAQLDAAYAYYKFDEPDSAIAAAERFIKLHPKNPHVDYAYYLKGLANFNRGKTIVSKVIPRDPSERDPTPMLRAFEDFSVILKRYPDSRYADDARKRMVYLRNKLAEYELNVADYYMRREAYVAAINRAKYVLENYQGARAIPQALKTLVRAYRKLGLNDLARDALRVLRTNYPKEAAELSKS
jgi:outer membrane protein assembly factor BamD